MAVDLTRMKGPSDPRSTWMNGIIQVHVTRACDLACTGCTQGSNLGGKPTVITLENFEKAIISLRDYYGVVGIFGGNPTLHPKFEDLCEILTTYIPFDRRGLWSNNLRGFGKLCRETFNPAVSNLNVHTDMKAYEEMKRDWPECSPKGTNDSRHSPPYVAMKDMVDMNREEQERLIEYCDVNQYWSAMICQFRGELRAYFCELAGAQSMLHEHDPDYPDTGLKIIEDWWKRPMKDFAHQVEKHCFECGVPLRGKGDYAHTGSLEYVSKSHLKIYNPKKSREVRVIESREQLRKDAGQVQTATDYIENGMLAGATDSKSAKTKVPFEDAKILMCIPTVEMARRADFYDYIDALQKTKHTAKVAPHGQSPARNRNIAIQEGLKNGFDYMFFIDDDVMLRPDSMRRLYEHDVDIVTALYYMRNFPHTPIIFNHVDEIGRAATHYLQPSDSGLIEILGAGLGACLIKMDVFRKVQAPWVRLGELEPDHWCDDLGFFRRCRDAGFKLYCDLDVRAGHVASAIVWPNYLNGRWVTTYDTYGIGSVSFPQKQSHFDTLQNANS